MTILDLVLAGLFVVAGTISAVGSLRTEVETSSTRERVLLAVSDAAKAGFWFALGGLFLGYALVENDRAFTWFVLVVIAMAALRLVAATFLARR